MTAEVRLVGTVWGTSYSSDLTDEQRALLEPVFNAPGKRGPMKTQRTCGCDARHLPHRLPVAVPARVLRALDADVSQFRRWSRNGTWARALTVLHAAARETDGRGEPTPSMVVIDTHLARGDANSRVHLPTTTAAPTAGTKGASAW